MDSLKKIIYYNSNYLDVKNGGISAWQGIRIIDKDVFLICGTTNPTPQTGNGIIYSGNLSFTNGSIFYLNVPNSKYTSIYGPNYNFETGIFNFVGSFTDQNNYTKGFLYTGKLNNVEILNNKNYLYPSVNKKYEIVFVHSIINDFMVGNAGNNDSFDVFSFLYNINDLKKPIEIKFPNSKTTTTYGICYNTYNNTYTLVGGYSQKKIQINKIYQENIILPIGNAFIVNYNPTTNTFENWTTIQLPLTNDIVSHIQGISNYFNIDGKYSICIDAISKSKNIGYYATITRDKSLGFIVNKFNKVKYGNDGISTINSVANNNIVGLNISLKNNQAFQASILD